MVRETVSGGQETRTQAKFKWWTMNHKMGSKQAVTTEGGKDRARHGAVQISLVGFDGWGGPSQLGAVKRQRASLQKSDPPSTKGHTAKKLAPRQTVTSHGPRRIIWISSGLFAFVPSALFGRVWTMNVEFLSLIINAIEIGRVPRFTVKPFHLLP